MMTTGERIRYFRKQRKLTQVQLAEMTGIHPVSIRKYEINLMQPQIEQINRIAAALNVNASAISGFNSTAIRFETVGDLMGLLISWHKAGILSIEGVRDAGHYIQMETARLVPSPLLANYLTICVEDKRKEKAVPWNSFCLDMIDYKMLHDLLNWERFNYIYHRVTEAPDELWDDKSRAEYDNLGETLELIEMELQSSQKKLSFMENK